MLTDGRTRRGFPYWRVLVFVTVVGWLAVIGAIAVVWFAIRWLG